MRFIRSGGSGAAVYWGTGEFDWNELTKSYVLSGSSWGTIATVFAGARLAELWSPRLMVALSYLANAVCHFLVPVLARWSVVALVASQGPEQPTRYALMSAWFPPSERQTLVGLVFSTQQIGLIVSSSLSGALIASYGWELVFYLYGGALLVFDALWLLAVHDCPSRHPGISQEERDFILGAVRKEPRTRLRAPWLGILTSSAVWAHVSMHVAYTWITYMYKTELANYLKNVLHYDIKHTGFIAALPFLFGWLTELGFSVLSQWLQRRNCIDLLNVYRIFNGVATLGPAAALIALPRVACDSTAIVALLVAAKSCSSAFLGGSILSQMDLAINYVGSLSGLAGTFKQAVAVGAPMLTGAVINDRQTLSAWSEVFYISSVISALPFFVYLVFGSVQEQPWNRPA
ncbi:sialin-like [Bacillus rossius redtenbacheri]|uniref:sialin-like n=1 Tax=Bacillus rossius redtenbacheri TaxID=93214 RepID=UPI002FDDFBAE